eukprot:gene183-137_t
MCYVVSSFVLLFSAIGASGAVAGPENGRRPFEHVVVIGIDGLGGWYADSANMPFLKGGINATFTHRMRSQVPFSSGPNWATLLTGMTPTEHGIVGDDFWEVNPQYKWSRTATFVQLSEADTQKEHARRRRDLAQAPRIRHYTQYEQAVREAISVGVLPESGESRDQTRTFADWDRRRFAIENRVGPKGAFPREGTGGGNGKIGHVPASKHGYIPPLNGAGEVPWTVFAAAKRACAAAKRTMTTAMVVAWAWVQQLATRDTVDHVLPDVVVSSLTSEDRGDDGSEATAVSGAHPAGSTKSTTGSFGENMKSLENARREMHLHDDEVVRGALRLLAPRQKTSDQSPRHPGSDSSEEVGPTPNITFVHLIGVDAGGGHRAGWGSPAYMREVTIADDRVRKIYEGYAARVDRERLENTLFMVVSDHG